MAKKTTPAETSEPQSQMEPVPAPEPPEDEPTACVGEDAAPGGEEYHQYSGRETMTLDDDIKTSGIYTIAPTIESAMPVVADGDTGLESTFDSAAYAEHQRDMDRRYRRETLRHLAAQVNISMADAMAACKNSPRPQNDSQRAQIVGMMARLRIEVAEEIIRQTEKTC